VKEKFGGLRIHVNHANDAICQRIEVAKQESSVPARFAASPGNGGKAIGLRLCVTSTREQGGSEKIGEQPKFGGDACS